MNLQEHDTKRIAVILRHAERFEIDKMSNALEALLTENGKKKAYNLGIEMSRFSPFIIHYSPVKRCQETAEYIHRGIISQNQTSTLGGDNVNLGGPYIRGDWHAVADMVERIGQEIFIRKWFNNEISDSLIAPLEESAKLQLNILSGQLVSDESSYINITHDWNIMILREYYLGLKHEDIGQPSFLDGLWAYNDNDTIVLSSLNTQKIIPLDSIALPHSLKS